MHKIKIPLTPLLGSPLTDEELKSIIGGQINDTTRKCTCKYMVGRASDDYFKEETTDINNAGSEADCNSRCETICIQANGSGCPGYSTTYTAVTSSN